MSRAEDLTGRVFGSLTVLRRGEDYVSPGGAKKARWVCYCSEYEREVLVSAGNLNSGNTTTGRGKDLQLEDLTGQVFGTLTVLRRGPDHVFPKGKASVRWVCWCSEFEREALVLATHLKSGTTTSGGGKYHGKGGNINGSGIYNQTRLERGDFNGQSAFLYLAELESSSGVFHKVGISKNPSSRQITIKSRSKCASVRFLDCVKAPMPECVKVEKLLLDVTATEPSWESAGLPRFNGHTECRLLSWPVLEDVRTAFRSFMKQGVAHHAV